MKKISLILLIAILDVLKLPISELSPFLALIALSSFTVEQLNKRMMWEEI